MLIVALACAACTHSILCQARVAADKGLLPEQVGELQRLVDAAAEENVGMAAVFTIAESVKDWLLRNNVDCGVRLFTLAFHVRALAFAFSPRLRLS